MDCVKTNIIASLSSVRIKLCANYKMYCGQIYVENKCERAVAPDLFLAGAVSFS